MNRLVILSIFTLIVVAQTACNQSEETSEQDVKMLDTTVRADLVEARPEIYAKVKLTTDISVLSENEQLVLPYLIKAAKLMDEIFWEESIPESVQVDMASLTEEQNLFYDLNYGPWDRLDNFNSFVNGVGEKPLGANFYPADMTKEEFESMTDVNKKSLYAVVRRNEEGKLITIPFHQFFDQQLKAADLLDSAAAIATDEELKKYLSLRAKALRTDEYDESDIAWLNMQNNTLDLIVGPIENYEDRLFGYKAAHEAYVLVKDKGWSAKLAK